MSIYGFERVADSGACDYCAAIDGAYVKSADASPIHPNCGCGLDPLTEEHPNAVWLPDGTHVGDGYAVNEHGELGATLGAPGDAFTGPKVVDDGLTPLQRMVRDTDPATATPEQLADIGKAVVDQMGGEMRAAQANIADLEAAADAHNSEANMLWDQGRVSDGRSERARAAGYAGWRDDAAFDRWIDAVGRTGKARKERDAAIKGINKVRQKALKEALEEVRPMGGKLDQMPYRGPAPDLRPGAVPEATSADRRALMARINKETDYLPQRWVERMNHNGRVLPEPEAKGDRAHYLDRGFSGGEVHIADGDKRDIVLHEVSHRAEYTVPNLMEQEDAWVRSRATGRIGPIKGYDKSEVAYPGNFVERYMGKVYDRPTISETTGMQPDRVRQGYNLGARAGEAFTCGQQGVWYDTWGIWEKDLEMVHWVVGVLAVL